VSVDSSVLWIGPGLAMAAAVLLAYVPRLPSPHAPAGLGLTNGSVRITPGTNRRLRLFATTQIAFSFVLLAGAGMLLATLVAMRTATTGYNMRQVLAFDIPTAAAGIGGAKVVDFYQEATRRIARLPGVEGVTVGAAPWRDAGSVGPASPSRSRATSLRTARRTCTGGSAGRAALFAVLGVPLLAAATSPTMTATTASRYRSSARAWRSACFRTVRRSTAMGTDPYLASQRLDIVGVVADVDDENVVRGSAQTICRFANRARGPIVVAPGDPRPLPLGDARGTQTPTGRHRRPREDVRARSCANG
jgi:hypothetical protein